MIKKEHLLVALDLNENTKPACLEALNIAKQLKAEVTIVHAIEYIPYYPYFPYDADKVEKDLNDEITKKMCSLEELFKNENIQVNKTVIAKDKAFRVICDTANKVGATRIVIGVGPHYLMESMIGSTADKVIRLANQAVFLLNPYKEQSGFKKILCGYDFTESSEKALLSGYRMANNFNAELTVIHIIPEKIFSPETAFFKVNKPVFKDIENAVKTKLLEKFKALAIDDIKIKTSIKVGDPVNQISDYIKKHKTELLIVGTKSQNSFQRLFMGSTTEKLIRKAPCNIMTTKKDVED